MLWCIETNLKHLESKDLKPLLSSDRQIDHPGIRRIKKANPKLNPVQILALSVSVKLHITEKGMHINSVSRYQISKAETTPHMASESRLLSELGIASTPDSVQYRAAARYSVSAGVKRDPNGIMERHERRDRSQLHVCNKGEFWGYNTRAHHDLRPCLDWL